MNKKPKSFLVISRFSEDVNWLNDLTDNYIIYNKGNQLEGFNQKIVPNIGGNQYDIFSFIYENYDNLPDLITFMQGDPFDHCLKPRFDKLIYNESFTPLFGDKNYPDGNYSEYNNNWYIIPTMISKNVECIFKSFDEYMNIIFSDYTHLDTLIFPPGSQIIVEKERCLYYSKDFWKKLMSFFPNDTNSNGGAEAHIIERSIQIIFENKFKERI